MAIVAVTDVRFCPKFNKITWASEFDNKGREYTGIGQGYGCILSESINALKRDYKWQEKVKYPTIGDFSKFIANSEPMKTLDLVGNELAKI